jgi:LuxR family quorum-sensing system transcriptional regulator SolR
MTDLAISKDELQTLLEIINDLTIAPDCTQYIDDVVAKINLLVPFEKCVLFHEQTQEPAAATLMYEFSDLTGGRNRRNFKGGEALKIERYLKCFEQMEVFQNAFFWRGVTRANEESDREIVEFLEQVGLSQGVAGTVDSLNGKKSDNVTLIQLQYADQPFAPKHLWFINSIVFYLHLCFERCATSPQMPVARHNLTRKEKEVLQWVVEGKTSWEVGKILSMSERTVKFHLRNIYTKFNVVNRAQAVMMASRLNLI